jgi:hypothetical protein
MNKQLPITQRQEFSNFVIFKIDDSKVNIDVKFEDEILWLTQKQIAELFEEKVLDKKVVCLDFRHTEDKEKNCEK